ncbi:MAG: carboxypeptidase-like regulatory domain-containing protein [bacterium]
MTLKRVVIVANACVFIFVGPLHGQSNAAIRGRVLNGTIGGRPVSGAEVRLLRMSQGSAQTFGPVRTDSRGAFVFPSIRGDGVYVAATNYGGVVYTSSPVRVQPGEPTIADITVYEPATQRPAIFFPFRIVLVERIGVGIISLREIVGVANPSLRTYVGQNDTSSRSFSLTLPNGAERVAAIRGMISPLVEKRSVAEMAPLPPGVHEITVAYQLRYWGSSAKLWWTLDEDTGSMDVFLPDQGVALKSNTLEPKPARAIRGQRFLRAASDTLGKGERVEVVLTGLPANYAPLARWSAAVLAVILLAKLLLALRIPPRRQPSADGT